MYDDCSINMSGFSIDDIYVGQTARFSKTVTESDIYTFAGVTGDFNPIHVNKEYAAKTRFGERIAHGMLTASFFSTVLGMMLPGAGAIYLSQNSKFLLPVKIGDTITAQGVVTEINKEKKIFTVETTAFNQRNEVVIKGEAKMMATK